MSELQGDEVLLELEGSAAVLDAVRGLPDLTARMVDASAEDGGCVTVCEAVDGKIFPVWREERRICSSSGWLAAHPSARLVLAPLFPSEGIEVLVVIPDGYRGASSGHDLFVIEMKIEGRRRSWRELRDAVELAAAVRDARVARGELIEDEAPRLRLEPVLHRGESGCPAAEAMALLGMSGRLQSQRDPRKVVYWLDSDPGPHARNAGLGMFCAPLPPMNWKEKAFYRQTGIVLPPMTLPEVPVLAPKKSKGSDRLRSDLSAKSKGKEPDPRQGKLF